MSCSASYCGLFPNPSSCSSRLAYYSLILFSAKGTKRNTRIEWGLDGERGGLRPKVKDFYSLPSSASLCSLILLEVSGDSDIFPSSFACGFWGLRISRRGCS